ncbi:hypothetical protein EW146_g7542 [Bondarzewia mesenterica]|uniref:Tail specific protease domain-containing protein n=1 Tax=Bondarzewia mesenterica TaxID=1095465 RepID=A0A4S4LL12_9AGAM|nr:hypothetical protein EW146_g7542 [Bondarzewia mesenterica]
MQRTEASKLLSLRFVATGALLAALTAAAPTATNSDPCANIAGLTFVSVPDALACQKSFAFNETLRQNVMSVVSNVFDFYTFEDYYLNSPPPFQESTTNIRAELARINSTDYDTDYDFNQDLYQVVNRLNDGHTEWWPFCYFNWENLLPTPIVSLEVNGTQNVYIAPDSVDFISLAGSSFANFYSALDFDWQRLAGAKVIQIEGMDAYDYVDVIADTVTGNYLDHGVRVNSVFSGYRFAGSSFSQKFGDLAGQQFSQAENISFTLIPAGSDQEESVTVPFLAAFMGSAFEDRDSYWANNCAANSDTNGVDMRLSSNLLKTRTKRSARGIGRPPADAIGLPTQFQPNLPTVGAGASGVITSYVLPDNITGVMYIGSFQDDFLGFETDVATTITAFKAAGITKLLIDVTNNAGGIICNGVFLHQYLAGGYQTSIRANPLAQKIVEGNIQQDLGASLDFYSPDNWAFLNDTKFPINYNYVDPAVPLSINGQTVPMSQRFEDICTPYQVSLPATPPFDLQNVAIVGNGNCASTCAQFITLMFERHNTSIAVFGGMAGNQVLEWTDLDSEIKTAGVKDDPLAPPDLLVSANMRHNWRTVRFPYTPDTYNNPQNLWTFAAEQLFN